MFCQNCGHSIPDGAKYCSYCGAKVTPLGRAIKAPSPNGSGQRKQVFDGAIHKCPNCGQPLDAFALRCPKCGYEIRSDGSYSVRQLSEDLLQITDVNKRQERIRTFYVPSTKEDIYDFLILAASMANDPECDEAWMMKLDQVYLKAKLVFKDSDEFTQIESEYRKAKKVHNHFIRKKFIHRNLGILLCLLFALIGIVLAIVGFLAINFANNSKFVFLGAGGCSLIILAIGSLISVLSISSKKKSENNSAETEIENDLHASKTHYYYESADEDTDENESADIENDDEDDEDEDSEGEEDDESEEDEVDAEEDRGLQSEADVDEHANSQVNEEN